MDEPAAIHLLETWEHGRQATPGERGLLMLGLAEPGEPPTRLAARSAGERDAALLELRGRLFGPRLNGLATCAHCAEPLELEFDLEHVRARPDARAGELTVTVGTVTVRFRLPTAGDLAELGRPRSGSPEQWLLERCVTAARDGDRALAVQELDPEVLDTVAGAMEVADPQADVELDLTCPACGGHWIDTFDVVAYLWLELEAWALRMLDAVAALAFAFGWSERDILSLSAWRRNRYLEAIGA